MTVVEMGFVIRTSNADVTLDGVALIAVLNYVLSIVTATENAKDLNKEQLFVNVIMVL